MVYRMDSRNIQEFAKDIKRAHQKEALIIVRLAIAYFDRFGTYPTIQINGCGMDGKLLKDKEVNSAADFKLNGVLYEITKSDKICKKYFHEKIAKVDRCIKDSAHMIFVNGLFEPEPKYINLSPEDIKNYSVMSDLAYGKVFFRDSRGLIINKPSYKFDVLWFENIWRPLPEFRENIPAAYKKIMYNTL